VVNKYCFEFSLKRDGEDKEPVGKIQKFMQEDGESWKWQSAKEEDVKVGIKKTFRNNQLLAYTRHP